jgi:ATP-dependent RNA helicase DDX49/DBP8
VPAGLKQQYIFMPNKVRDAYLATAIRHLMTNGGLKNQSRSGESSWTLNSKTQDEDAADDEDETGGRGKARSAIVFVSTCERAAYMDGTLRELGVNSVALHSLISQDRRRAALGKFKSQQVRVLVATDVASRGLDIPEVDLVLNADLPRKVADYIHRVGRTARAGRRGKAVSFVGENDVKLIQDCEKASGRELSKCEDIKDDDAVKMLGPVSKAARLAKMKLLEIGFDEIVQKQKAQKAHERKVREKLNGIASGGKKKNAKKQKT